MSYKAPFLKYDTIRHYAEEFLNRFHPGKTLPIPIERIIEIDLKMNIIPMYNLRKDYGTEGFLANNLQDIYVDEYAYNNLEPRYRFTLAHEIGHRFLHKDLYDKVNIKSIDDWVSLIDLIESNQYSWFETHAYNFAGLILVPPTQLKIEYTKAIELLRNEKYDLKGEGVDPEIINSYTSIMISKTFRVSEAVITKRLSYDSLNPESID